MGNVPAAFEKFHLSWNIFMTYGALLLKCILHKAFLHNTFEIACGQGQIFSWSSFFLFFGMKLYLQALASKVETDYKRLKILMWCKIFWTFNSVFRNVTIFRVLICSLTSFSSPKSELDLPPLAPFIFSSMHRIP